MCLLNFYRSMTGGRRPRMKKNRCRQVEDLPPIRVAEPSNQKFDRGQAFDAAILAVTSLALRIRSNFVFSKSHRELRIARIEGLTPSIAVSCLTLSGEDFLSQHLHL